MKILIFTLSLLLLTGTAVSAGSGLSAPSAESTETVISVPVSAESARGNTNTSASVYTPSAVSAVLFDEESESETAVEITAPELENFSTSEESKDLSEVVEAPARSEDSILQSELPDGIPDTVIQLPIIDFPQNQS